MNKYLKWTLISLAILILIICLVYGANKLYNYAIKIATSRIKEGVSEGISKGIGKAINPFKWLPGS